MRLAICTYKSIVSPKPKPDYQVNMWASPISYQVMWVVSSLLLSLLFPVEVEGAPLCSTGDLSQKSRLCRGGLSRSGLSVITGVSTSLLSGDDPRFQTFFSPGLSGQGLWILLVCISISQVIFSRLTDGEVAFIQLRIKSRPCAGRVKLYNQYSGTDTY